MEIKEEIYSIAKELENSGRYTYMKEYYQHGNTTVYQHCINVAIMSCKLVEYFNCAVDRQSLIRGALLHDYFLYDWHEKNSSHRLHGFFHPKTALKNAEKDFVLSKIEKNIIICHMFPLTVMPPKTKEGWIVCIADKWSAMMEIVLAVTVKVKGIGIDVGRSMRY